jgi:tRNA(Ile)-lysidine synthase
MAAVAGDEEAYWGRSTGQLASANFTRSGPAVLFQAPWLASLPRAVARRLVRAALEIAKGDLRRIDLAHVDAILALTARTEGSGRFQAPGVDILRSFDWIRVAPQGLYRAEAESADYEFPADAPGRYPIPGTEWVLTLEVIEAKDVNRQTEAPSPRYNERVNALDLGRIAGGVSLRNWRPGDRYRPTGHASEVSIKSLFQEARVPLWDRRKWPVMTCGESILWAARFGPAAGYAATPRSGAALIVRETLGKGQKL